VPADLPEEVDDLGGHFLGLVEFGWDLDPEFLGALDDRRCHGLAEWLSPLARASSSRCDAGTGRALMVAQVSGSRGSSRVKRSSKVREEASRSVNGSPRSQLFRGVAIREVWRNSSLNTEPCGTHGETRIAGTR
jgi:hypothetical protein